MSPYPITFRDTLEIMIEHSDSYYININAGCEEAFGYLDTTIIKPDQIFVTVPVTFNSNKFKLINPTNIPLHFNWDEIINDEMKAVFSPRQGVVPPRSYQEISFEFIFFTSNITLLFI